MTDYGYYVGCEDCQFAHFTEVESNANRKFGRHLRLNPSHTVIFDNKNVGKDRRYTTEVEEFDQRCEEDE